MQIRRMRKHNRSFVKTCLYHFALYSLIIFALYSILSYFISIKIYDSFPYIDSVMEYQKELEQDDFDKISKWKYRGSDFLVFGEKQQEIYATSKALSGTINSSDLSFISDFDSDLFYSVLMRKDSKGEVCYWINELRYNMESSTDELVNYCILDHNYNVIAGEPFLHKKQLSLEELDLLRGTYKGDKDISKCTYTTADGRARTLVFLAPIFSENDYNSKLNSSNKIWFIGLPILALVIAIQVMLFSRKIKRSLKPLDHAIVAYGKGDRVNINDKEIPREFNHIIANFNTLLDQLDLAKLHKEEADQEKQRMLADISHDLKTPLTVIQGYAKAFVDGMVPPDKVEKYMKSIYNKVTATTDLIDSLFTYTKMDHPDYVLNMEHTDLCEFSKEYLAAKYAEIELHGFMLEISIPEASYDCIVDQTLLRRLYDNLIENALKYNPSGTKIGFTITMENSKLYIQIADTGIGISKELQQTIFEPFITGNSARTSGKGTGLGMAIARRIVELHKGSISLLGSENSNYSTIFQIVLPMEKTRIDSK